MTGRHVRPSILLKEKMPHFAKIRSVTFLVLKAAKQFTGSGMMDERRQAKKDHAPFHLRSLP